VFARLDKQIAKVPSLDLNKDLYNPSYSYRRLEVNKKLAKSEVEDKPFSI
jgi:hypothetical protein